MGYVHDVEVLVKEVIHSLSLQAGGRTPSPVSLFLYSHFLLELGPGVFQRYGSVENQSFAVIVLAEISVSDERQVITDFGVEYFRFSLCIGHNFQRIGV